MLNPDIEHPHVDDEAALMYRNGGEGVITEADLEYICETAPCSAFVPES